jgi:hypothetical protein
MKKQSTFRKSAVLSLFAAIAVAVLCGVASAQTASSQYRGTARDPFTPYRAPARSRRAPNAPPAPVAPPSIEARIQQYRERKQAAMAAQMPAPKPTTALLLNELQVTGIFRTPRGYAAMVEATPIHMSYVIYPGEVFFNGQLVAIEEGRLVFRRETRWTNGRREMTVETMPLRQSSVVADSLSATPTAATSGTGTTAGGAVVTGRETPPAAEPERNRGQQNPPARTNP